ncbi:Glycine--tRNA ligase 1, mitochondrial [Sporothrix epigloea]|uniref:glycine--tRNA ligase n=1 Tax=Sporothrix epigloea TaxID=1892477 RepID=A0ABP0E8E3_9PEZI
MTTTATTLKGQPLDKAVMDSMLRRRLFYTPSFEIYGGVSGLYDYGPPGCALQANIVDLWRKHFILEEDMLEVDCTVLTPHEVLKTSGHVDKFADWMCKDAKSGEIFRADHFVEEILEQRLIGNKAARGQKVDEADKADDPKKKKKLKGKGQEAVRLDDAVVQEYEETLAQIDNYNGEQLGELIKKFDLRNPATGIQPEPPTAFNLMFGTQIGPSGGLQGYMRPETAQGQFLNFSKLLEFNMQSMPFASASIGKSYRNEISPRAGLLRVREFLMAEIEHFVDPEGGKKHHRFHEVENIELVLLDRDTQLSGKTTPRTMSIGAAVRDRVVDNETLGYFLARIHLFLKKIGVDQSKIRFRQHMANEMAHYATDCWDAELLTSSGWVECVGCADRSAYDLSVHAKKTGAPLIVRQRLETPKVIEEWTAEIDKKKFGPRFKKDAKAVEAALLGLSQDQLEAVSKDLKANGKVTIDVTDVADGKAELTSDLVAVEFTKRTENIREFTPNVIEPSFGIGRILYSLLEHNYWSRGAEGGDEARGVLSFTPSVAPTKVLIVPISSKEEFKPIVRNLSQRLRALGIASRTDDSTASIGKRYSRNDELGTPFGVTVDFQTINDGTVTLRERDTTVQVRASEDKILEAIQALVQGNKTWKDIQGELPAFESQETEISVR